MIFILIILIEHDDLVFWRIYHANVIKCIKTMKTIEKIHNENNNLRNYATNTIIAESALII